MDSGGTIGGCAAEGTAARLRLTCWGDFAITDAADGADLKPRGRKTRALLAYLALHPGKPVSRERLAGLLWGDRGEEQARASLRQAILELKPLANGDRHALVVERDHVTLDRAAFVTDLDELEAAAALGDHAALIASLPDPEDRLFANLDHIDEGFDDWLAIERTRRRDAILALIEDASATALAFGDTRHARALHARQQELDPGRAAALSAEPGGVRAAVIALRDSPALALSRTARPLSGVRRAAWLVAALLALGLLGMLAWQRSGRAPAPPTTIAVLPFKDLSGQSDISFADGLSEEITGQLAREPGLRVAGRTSSSQFKDGAVDLAEVGRRLGVKYILEGSVRTAGERVRVNVALAQASDGLQLWAESFDGTLDDVLGIQDRIGANVAAALGHRLVAARPFAGTRATSGMVYTLYLSARGLIRERNAAAMSAAKERLTRALRLDPSFAPGWSSLAQVTRFEANTPGPMAALKREQAIGQARRALALAPDLAEAHGVLGMILGFDDRAGQGHIKRAASLDPGNPEFQFWLGHVYGNEPDFVRMREAYDRVFKIDPLWNYAPMYAITSAWQMGHRRQAIDYVRRIERDGSRYQAHLARAVLAKQQGDFSAAAAELAMASAATSDSGRRAGAAYERAFVFYSFGRVDEARAEWSKAWEAAGNLSGRAKPLDPYMGYLAIRQGRLPSLAELRARNRDAFEKDMAYSVISAKLLINAGRAKDVVHLYESEQGFLGLSRTESRQALWRDTLSGTIVAAALREIGRGAEADAMLIELDRRIGAVLAWNRGQTTTQFLAEAAPVWAMLGKHRQALAALEKARAGGWSYIDIDEGDTSLPDIGDEPALRSLRGNPRFERFRAALRADLDRERRELTAQLAPPARNWA